MSTFVIWMDSDKAQIFALKSTGIEKSHLERKHHDHHTVNKKDHHGDPSVDHYYQDLATRLNSAEEVLLLGPGLAKTHFKTHLENHGMGKKVVGVESSDHPTDNQILAEARKFFHTYNLYNHPIKQG